MKTFEDEFMDKQSEIISLCLEIAEERADKIYVYASIEKHSRSFNVFFQSENQIKYLHQIGTADDDLQWQLLRTGGGDLDEIDKICKKHNRPTPTEMKMVYDVRTGGYDAEYKYEEVCGADQDITDYEIFTQWVEEERAKL